MIFLFEAKILYKCKLVVDMQFSIQIWFRLSDINVHSYDFVALGAQLFRTM